MIISNDISKEELKVFLQETDDILQSLDEDIIKLEKEDNKEEILQRVFRGAHTLKGSSGMIGHKRMAEVTHAMENLLDKLRNKKIILNSHIIDLLLYSLDILKILRADINKCEDSEVDIESLTGQINNVLNNESYKYNPEKSSGANTPDNDIEYENNIEIDETSSNELTNAVTAGQKPLLVKINLIKSSIWKSVRCFQSIKGLSNLGKIIVTSPSMNEIEMERVGEVFKVLLCTDVPADKIETAVKSIEDIESVKIDNYNLAHGKNMTAKPEIHNGNQTLEHGQNISNNDKSEVIQSVRVDVKVLDKLMNMVEELVIDRSRISQVGKGLESRYQADSLVCDLQETSNHIVKVVNELYQDIMKVRMLPISIVFNKFPRLVRDLAQKQQKVINFKIFGEATELDRNIIEQIRDPLVHLLRNAVDHGIEPREERLAKSKPETAEIVLTANQEEGHILITLKDDGKGINPEKVRTSAIKRGIISAETANNMSDDEILDLIFSPGISTAEKITEISGRGVGLDIVRNNIEKINGSVSLSTKVDEGTTFTIKLPLTVAVFRGLMVDIAQSIYIIPMTSVIETKKIQQNDISTIFGEGVMRLRDKVIPLLQINRILNKEILHDDNYQDKYVVIVKSNERLAGIIVERLLEQQEFVIKPLGNYLGELKGIAGATILGNGHTALILDIPTLIRMNKIQNIDNINKIPVTL